MVDREIKSIAELITALETDHKDYGGSIWFRGQLKKSWKLKPSYFRLASPPSEGTLLKRFKQNAAMLLEREPRDWFDWLFLMQHYGLPTRLLDWSESPLVALYFSLDDNGIDPDEDAAVWCLRPSILNEAANIKDEHEEHFIPSFDDIYLENYSIKSLEGGPKGHRLKLSPIAAIATRNSSRIQAQLGNFTIHHSNDTAIEEIGNGCHVYKYSIPHNCRLQIKEHLRLLGFSRFTMFPELASIGENIKRGLS